MTIKLRADQKGAKITGAKSLYPIMREILLREKGIDKNRERFWVASLAVNGTLLNIELVGLGRTNTVDVEASAVFSIALQKDSKAVMLIHNHPSGNTEPSNADDDVTELMAAIGELVKVPVIDHMVIGDKGYFSYEERGIMEDFRRLTNALDPRPAKEVERLRLEMKVYIEELHKYKKMLAARDKRLKKLNIAKPKTKAAVKKRSRP